jgi:ribonuclease Z
MTEKINITFLGTSQAVPSATRNHTSILLNYKNENILVDCGEGTQRQFRKAKINPCRITKLLITHWHGDHVLGLPGLFQTLALNNYSRTLEIYGPKGTRRFIEELYKIFVPVEKLKLIVKEVDEGIFFQNKDFKLSAFKLYHDTPCNGYLFEEKNKLRINREKLKKLHIPNVPELGKLIQGKDAKINGKLIKAKAMTYFQKGRKISFILDTKLNPNLAKSAKDSDLAIVESTYSAKDSDLAQKYNHMTSANAALVAKQAKARELILTHISQRYEHHEKALLDEAKKIFKNTKLAEDFMKVDL